MFSRLPVAFLTVAASFSLAAERATLTGRVTDVDGQALENATVMIYHAGVKQGYSTFCPSCYVDCGKRVTTDHSGVYTIRNLDRDLRFELLVARDGYAATFVKKVDPARGPAETAALAPRAPVDDAARAVRGRVAGPHGRPLAGALVMPEGVCTRSEKGDPFCGYFEVDGLERMAVTNAQGEFEVAYKSRATGILLRVEARGLAPKVIAMPTGTERKTISLSDGATVRGRLLHEGKPVAGVEVGLSPQRRPEYGRNLEIVGTPFLETRIGTREDGSFVIPNVPVPATWYVYGKMGSIATLGAVETAECATTRDNEDVNVGDLEIHPGYRLRGKVTLSDGKAIASGMHLAISSNCGGDSQEIVIGSDGRFEFGGLAAGTYGIFASVQGYQPPKDIEVIIKGDTNDFKVTLDRAVP